MRQLRWFPWSGSAFIHSWMGSLTALPLFIGVLAELLLACYFLNSPWASSCACSRFVEAIATGVAEYDDIASVVS